MWNCVMPNRAFQRTTRLVLVTLSQKQGDNPHVDISARELAEMLDCAPRTVERAIASLRTQNRIRVDKTIISRGRINRYAVIPES